MIKRKSMTNAQIFGYANNILENFPDLASMEFPVKVHFYFQKNMNAIIELGKEIDQSRIDIFNKYGTSQDDGTYKFEADKVDQVNKEIEDLFGLEQEVKVHMIPLYWFDEMHLTAAQVASIDFMIQDDEDEEEPEE